VRLLRIKLHDFRGVSAREIEFAPRGVTLVEGPNESGKSSLADALALVLTEKDSSKKRHVLACQPVGRDAGPEVEVELESGPYHLTVSKRFVRRPRTVLEIAAPRPEKGRTGTAAHERLQEILAETLDRTLFEALWVKQGRSFFQEPLGESTALGDALQQTTGAPASGERELGLLERAEAEYLRYFTPGRGDETGLLREARKRETQAAETLQAMEDALAQAESDIERCSRLARECAALEREALESEALLKRRTTELEELEKREEQLQRLELKCRTAQMARTVARKALESRQTLGGRLANATCRREELEENAARHAPALAEAEELARRARIALDTAHSAARKAQAALRQRERERDYFKARLDLDQLSERRERITRALERLARARAVLERSPIDDALLAHIEACNTARVQALARLETGGPHIALTALDAIVPEIDGKKTPLEAGGRMGRTVERPLRIVVPGAIEIEIAPGTSLDQLVAARDGADHALQAALEKAGADSVEAARAAHRACSEAQRTEQEATRALKENLRDLDLETMDAKIGTVRAWVEGFKAERAQAQEAPLPQDGFDAAQQAKKEADEADHRARAELDAAQREAEAAQSRLIERKQRAGEMNVELRVAREAERALRAELQAARNEKGDREIEQELERTGAAAQEAEKTLAAEAAALKAAHPDRARDLKRNAEQAAATTTSRLETARRELRDLELRLELAGSNGLFEACDEARTAHLRAQSGLERLARRAAAADLLYELLSEERDRARKAYATPLREKIVALGRYLFDESFSVELDDELCIAQRTLGGKTLPFEELSTGAQEQLALIARLACALLVDEEEGAPLIFDDTLGYADPERLEGMCALLARAGERCQVIVLTSTPGRYRQVGEFMTVRL